MLKQRNWTISLHAGQPTEMEKAVRDFSTGSAITTATTLQDGDPSDRQYGRGTYQNFSFHINPQLERRRIQDPCNWK